jgi:hypothetical protein
MPPQQTIITSTTTDTGGNNTTVSPYIEKVCAFVKNPDFQSFRQEYLRSWSDIEMLFLYLTTADMIMVQFQNRYGNEISSSKLHDALKIVFATSTLRKKAVDVFRERQIAKDPHIMAPPPPLTVSNQENNNNLRRLPSYVFH